MRARAESPPPSKWIRSRGGTYARVILQRQRNDAGKKLYRLRYLSYDIKSPKLWTLADLNDAGVRWLKNKPRPQS